MTTSRVEPNISREVLFEKLKYNPHSNEQWELHRRSERFRVGCCGRRWGKSQWAGHELTLKLFVPQSINWVVGPEYTLCEKEFRVAWNDFKKLGLLGRCKTTYNVRQGNMRIFFPELESILECKSEKQPDSLVGEGVDHVCMSEAAKLNMTTWGMYIRPALFDKNGSADFPSTPQGFNWFKGMFDLGQNIDHPDYFSARYPSWTNPVLFPKGESSPEIQETKATVSEMYFAQEIAAEFTSFEGMIYPEFNEKIHVQSFEYNPFSEGWWAFDFGYVDPFVCLDISIDNQQRVWVWREYLVSYKPTFEHAAIIKQRENPAGFHIDQIAADPRGADEIATLSFALGKDISHNALGWSVGIEEIKRFLKVREDGLPGLIIHPRCTELIRQMKQLRAKQVKEGHNEKPGQLDYDDHGPDALRYFFNERFVLGGGATLRDIYNTREAKSEAAAFFKYESSISADKFIW